MASPKFRKTIDKNEGKKVDHFLSKSGGMNHLFSSKSGFISYDRIEK